MFRSLIRNVRADPKSIFGHFSAPSLAQTFTTYSWIGNSTCNPLLTAICGREASVRSRWRGGQQGGHAKPEMELSTMRPCEFFQECTNRPNMAFWLARRRNKEGKKVRIGSWKGSLQLTYLSANRHTLENTTTVRELHSRASLSRQGSPIHLAVRCPPSAT